MNRIKKIIEALLAKAHSTDSQAERDTFMSKAWELMEKHQIELHELGEDDPIGVTVGVAGQPGMASYKPMVQRALANFYGCHTVRTFTTHKDYNIELVGPESARETTVLMTPFVWEQVCKVGAVWATSHGKPSAHGIRMVAKMLCIRIYEEIGKREEVAEVRPWALATVDKIEAFKQRYYTGLKPTASGKVATSVSAAELAKGISIAVQVGRGATHALK